MYVTCLYVIVNGHELKVIKIRLLVHVCVYFIHVGGIISVL